MIRADCPGCGRNGEFADYLAGLTVICKECGQRIALPPKAAPNPASDAITASPPLPAPLPTSPIEVATRTDALQVGTQLRSAWLPDTPSIAIGTPESLLPQWAIDHAMALLRVGIKVSEVEQKLMTRGLTPGEASRIVSHLLESHVAAGFRPHELEETYDILHRVFSTLVAFLCLGLAYWFGREVSVGTAILFVTPPVAAIWFPVIVGGNAARVVGWKLLLIYLFYRILMLRR